MDYIDLVRKCIEFIELNINKKVTIEEIIENTCYSYPHFHRIFRDIAGDTISGYIRKRRLSCAAIELVKSEKQILDIALDYGFSSQQTFNRAFKDIFGIAPLQYRNCGMLDDIYEPFVFNIKEFTDSTVFKVSIEELPPMKIISCQEYCSQISQKYPDKDIDKIISKAWGRLIRWQMNYEYQKQYGKNTKIPNTKKLAEFFIRNQLHIAPNTRYFGFINPSPYKETEFGYETWAVLNSHGGDIENLNPKSEIEIKDFSGGLYAVAEAAYGQNSNLNEIWRMMHLWLFANPIYDYGNHQWLEEHITKADEGGFHAFRLYMAIKHKE